MITHTRYSQWPGQIKQQIGQAQQRADLKRSFPELKGFSRANLMYMRSFAKTWPDFINDPIVQQAVGQIP